MTRRCSTGLPSNQERTLLSLVDRVYEAALDPEVWPQVLNDTAKAVGARCGNTISMCTSECDVRFARWIGFDDEAGRRYAEHFAPLDPWVPRAMRHEAGSVVTGPMLIPERELVKTEFYNDFLCEQDVCHLISVIVDKSCSSITSFTMFRSASRRDFSSEERRLFQELRPHLQRAHRVRGRLGDVQKGSGSLAPALARLASGVFLLDGRGRVLAMNDAARAIHEAVDGIRAVRNELCIEFAQERKLFRRHLAAMTASRGCTTGDQPSDASIAVRRPSKRRPYVVLLAPLPESARSEETQHARIAVFVTDPEQAAALPADALQHLFGLTPGEARVVEAIVGGDRLAEAAERLGIGLETARTHVKRAFRKTETTTQAELVRLVLASAAGLRRG